MPLGSIYFNIFFIKVCLTHLNYDSKFSFYSNKMLKIYDEKSADGTGLGAFPFSS